MNPILWIGLGLGALWLYSSSLALAQTTWAQWVAYTGATPTVGSLITITGTNTAGVNANVNITVTGTGYGASGRQQYSQGANQNLLNLQGGQSITGTVTGPSPWVNVPTGTAVTVPTGAYGQLGSQGSQLPGPNSTPIGNT